MRIYDISMEIHENMMAYNNSDSKRLKKEMIHEFGEKGINESKMTIGLHTGTHIDAPFHMLKNGATIESVDLAKLISRAVVIDLTDVEDGITAARLLKERIDPDDFVIMKTRNSFTDEFDGNFVYLEKSGADFLAEKRVPGVGIDALGIERGQPGHETHLALMNAGCIIIEGLRLRDVPGGTYMMHALPLKIKGGDGAPARVILTDL
ncbi:MAG: cyclase family protein [Clostridia bacterium]|nr:cyclase family protein [Clostridia bacterium]